MAVETFFIKTLDRERAIETERERERYRNTEGKKAVKKPVRGKGSRISECKMLFYCQQAKLQAK